MNSRPRLTAQEIDSWKRKVNPLTGKKFNQNEIAAMFGVTRQAVSKAKVKSGRFQKTPREVALEHFPIDTGQRFNAAKPNKYLRDHMEYKATKGKGMSEDKLKRLRGWHRKLIRGNLVVVFDPNIPAIPGISSVGGFDYRPREERDGSLVLRENEYTNITPQGEVLLEMPEELPEA